MTNLLDTRLSHTLKYVELTMLRKEFTVIRPVRTSSPYFIVGTGDTGFIVMTEHVGTRRSVGKILRKNEALLSELAFLKLPVHRVQILNADSTDFESIFIPETLRPYFRMEGETLQDDRYGIIVGTYDDSTFTK